MTTYLLTYILIAYGITNIVVGGDVFSPLRDWIGTKSEFIHNIFSCNLCFSTWLGFIMSSILILTNQSTPSTMVFEFPFYVNIFLDGVFTAGAVWLLTQISE